MIAIRYKIERRAGSLTNTEREVKSRRALMAALGKRLEVQLRAHFLQKNQGANRNGFPRSNFWSKRIRSSTALAEVNETQAIVEIADPAMAQKIFGGTILPKEAKYLTLPARAEAAGRSPRFFDDLKFMPLRRGDLAGVLVKKNAKNERPFYFCLRKVEQNPDPTALPAQSTLDNSLQVEADRFYERLLNEGATA